MIRVLLTGVLLLAFCGAGNGITLEFVLPEAFTHSVPARVELSTPDGNGHWSVRESHEIELKPEGAKLDSSVSPPLRVQLTGRGIWAPLSEIPKSPPRDTVKIPVYTAGTLTGEFVGERSAERAAAARVEIRAVKDAAGQAVDSATLSCPVDEAGKFQCAAPTGTWRAAVYLEHDAPWASRRFVVAREQAESLGPIPRKKGGTVLGKIVQHDSTVESALSVILRQSGQGAGGVPRAPGMRFSTELNAFGELQIRGLPTGTWDVEFVGQSGRRGESQHVEIEPGVLTRLAAPVQMMPTRTFAVHVVPPLHPTGEPWGVELLQPATAGSTTLTEAAAGYCDEHGDWVSPPVYGDRFAVRLEGPNGGQFAWQEMAAVDGQNEVWLDLPLVWLEGSVSLGDDPLASSLQFKDSDEGATLTAHSDDDGRFGLLLPKPGKWLVQVDSRARQVRGYRESIDVVAHGRSATVDIRLPDTQLEGDVTDENGAPVAGAEVELRAGETPRRPTSTRTDTTGAFEFRALAEGPVSVFARDEKRTAGPVTVPVSENGTPPVHLKLQRMIEISGSVQSEGGGVSHATVFSIPVLPGPPPSVREESQSESDGSGRFTLRIPAATSRLSLVTLAPGYALTPVEIQNPTEAEPIRVTLRPTAGTLILSPLAKPKDSTGRIELVFVNGVPVDPHILQYWASLQDREPSEGPTVTVKNMPPGDYALCGLSWNEALFVMAGQALPKSDACDEGSLNAGGVLTLTSPVQ